MRQQLPHFGMTKNLAETKYGRGGGTRGRQRFGRFGSAAVVSALKTVDREGIGLGRDGARQSSSGDDCGEQKSFHCVSPKGVSVAFPHLRSRSDALRRRFLPPLCEISR
jgi:hypothetical protein